MKDDDSDNPYADVAAPRVRALEQARRSATFGPALVLDGNIYRDEFAFLPIIGVMSSSPFNLSTVECHRDSDLDRISLRWIN
jgi:hypothetical protein